MRRSPQTIERTFYPALLEIIRRKGGSGVQEVQYNSVPDIQFDFLNRPWLLSVKLGESTAILKAAFLQYMRHKEDSGIEQGMLLVLPESLRRVPPRETSLLSAIEISPVTVLIDAGPIKVEYRDAPFPDVLERLRAEIEALAKKGAGTHYSPKLVLDLLREQVVEMMQGLALGEEQVLELVTDWKLLTELARVDKKQAREVARFLGAYIFLSQVLFLRLFSSVHTDIVPEGLRITRRSLRRAFDKILEINYRPIFELDVLDSIPDEFLKDTFVLIWGMKVERVRYELPGRLFHALMPRRIRKLLAAFYTRPHAAELLARLTLHDFGATTFDPACGSGTILTAAYRRKLELFRQERKRGNPHRRFCEKEIYGSDIMPFAVHLTCANLAAMDVAETLDRTLVLQGDSLDIVSGKKYEGGVHELGLDGRGETAKRISAEEHNVVLPSEGIDAILMNPPFTKVERHIARYVDMDKFRETVGGEVGLWGHFIPLADSLLRDGGMCGAVLPINLLRGRESTHVRNFVFSEWSPQFIIKSTRSYAFSESAEYRDILLVAKKERPPAAHNVKVCYIKKSIASLSPDDIEYIGDQLEGRRHLRADELDIETYPIEAFRDRGANMLWFLACEDLGRRDRLVEFCGRFADRLERFPDGYFREGYRPVPKGVSQFLFLTRAFNPGRIEEAFLRFDQEGAREIRATTEMGIEYKIARGDLLPSLRTQVGLSQMDITNFRDYVAHQPYRRLADVKRAAGYTARIREEFWTNLDAKLEVTSTHTVVAHRLDYGSPNLHLIAWHSREAFSPSNQLNIVTEPNERTAQAVCVLFNSAIFLAQLFLLKEQSHARYANLRFYDFYEMLLYPPADICRPLQRIFKKYAGLPFPALRYQLDRHYDDRFREYWASQEEAQQQRLWPVLSQPVQPADIRISFDIEICDVLGVKVTAEELRRVYQVLAEEIITTRRLVKD